MARQRSCYGFSLIEMMVVIALLSIVAAVSVPKFIKYRSHLRKGECHRILTSLYEAEKAYFDGHGHYTDDLTQLSWSLEGSPRCLYGFKNSEKSGVNDTSDATIVERCGASPCYSKARMRLSENTVLEAEDLPDGTQVSDTAFTAGCVGNIDHDPTLDKAIINQDGVITQVIDDLAY